MLLKDNIRNYRKKYGLSQEYIANKLGYKSFTTVQKWETGLAEPPIGKLYELAEILNVPISKLLSNEEDKELDIQGSFLYTHIPSSVSAGTLEQIDPVVELPQIELPDILLGKYARNKKVTIMHVNGESMNNVIENGAIIAVLTDIENEDIKNGDMVVANNSVGYTVKRFFNDVENQRIILKPDSSDMSFMDISFDYEDCADVKIFGKVVMYNVIL